MMRPDDQKAYFEFLQELRRESDRGLALIGGAFLDEKLAATLAAFFSSDPALLHGKNAPLGSFSARIETCFALGLIEEGERNECDYIRRIRNEFAHKLVGTSFKQQRIIDLCKNLKSPLPDGPDQHPPRFRFENAVISMSLRLFYRPEYVAMEKREAKQWVDPSQVGWRRTADELPPDGIPVIVFGPVASKKP
jgi:mannitol operon repressor